MAHVLNDRVKETTTSTGTGTINLAGADAGFEGFVSAIGNSNTTYYAIAHQSSNEFEIGIGTVTDASPDTLSRTTVISSTNSDSLVDFSAGTKDVFCTLPASKAVFFDESSGSSDVSIGSRGTNPMGLSMVGTVLALTEQTNVASFQMDGAQASRIDMGSGPGTRQFVIYTDTANYSSLERKDAKPILFSTNNTERFRILQGGGIQLAAGNNISNASGDLTLDVVGSIILDADNNGEVSFQDDGTEIGKIFSSSSDFALEAGVQDKDIIFRGNDGGTAINALTLDMSSAGAAVFNSTVSHKGSSASSASNFISSWNNTGQSYNGYLYADSGGTGIFSHSSAAIQEGIYFQNSTDKTLFYNQANARGEIDGSGNLTMVGNVTAYGSASDIKLKENIEVIDNAVDKVKQLKGVTYNLKSDGNRLTGLIAQDLEKVLPEAVYETTDVDDDDKHLAIRYGNTVGLLVEAIKEQQEQIDTLNDYVKLQSATIMDMERRLNELEDK